LSPKQAAKVRADFGWPAAPAVTAVDLGSLVSAYERAARGLGDDELFGRAAEVAADGTSLTAEGLTMADAVTRVAHGVSAAADAGVALEAWLPTLPLPGRSAPPIAELQAALRLVTGHVRRTRLAVWLVAGVPGPCPACGQASLTFRPSTADYVCQGSGARDGGRCTWTSVAAGRWLSVALTRIPLANEKLRTAMAGGDDAGDIAALAALVRRPALPAPAEPRVWPPVAMRQDAIPDEVLAGWYEGYKAGRLTLDQVRARAAAAVTSYNEGANLSGAASLKAKPSSPVDAVKEEFAAVGGGAADLEPVPAVTPLLPGRVVGRYGSHLFDASLVKTDVGSGRNAFYHLQLLTPSTVVRRWGRVGTTQGGTKVEEFGSWVEAAEALAAVFREKTGNLFAQPRTSFTPLPGFMRLVDKEYGPASTASSDASGGSSASSPLDHWSPATSSLDEPTARLVAQLFDARQMAQSLRSAGLDTRKMPLGSITPDAVVAGYAALREVEAELQRVPPRRHILAAASNRFYTSVPHDFGSADPQLLDSRALLSSKLELLSTLTDVEIAQRLSKAAGGSETTVDTLFGALDLKALRHLQPGDRGRREVEALIAATKRHGVDPAGPWGHYEDDAPVQPTCNYEIEHVWEVEKETGARVDPARSRLLFHGSRLSNYVGILSQGLRIAPPAAPVTGYMYGKGVYFADAAAKSAEYCRTSADLPTGLLLVCAVDMGDRQLELTAGEYVTPERLSSAGADATHALSDFAPTGARQRSGTVLRHAEHIVYSTDRAAFRYLVQLKFTH
jgi:poly [ADP-ribose] polymerase